MERFGVIFVAVALGLGSYVRCDEANKACQISPSDDVNEITQEKLEATIKQLMESLKQQGFSEEELLSRVERDADAFVDKRSYEEKCKDTCGVEPLMRCRREFKPIQGHTCGNVEPLEPRGPFCNCAHCTGNEETRKEVREVDFEENEAIKSEDAKSRETASVYNEKWAPMAKFESPFEEDKRLQTDTAEGGIDDMPRRNLFSCQKFEPLYEALPPASGDADFQEQLRSITNEEEQPSLGIIKYHQKRSRDESEL